MYDAVVEVAWSPSLIVCHLLYSVHCLMQAMRHLVRMLASMLISDLSFGDRSTYTKSKFLGKSNVLSARR